MAGRKPAAPLGVDSRIGDRPYDPVQSHVWFRGNLMNASACGASKGPAAGEDAREAVRRKLKKLPKLDRSKFGFPPAAMPNGTLNPLYKPDDAVPEGSIGLTFEFEIFADPSGYDYIRPIVKGVHIPLRFQMDDPGAIDYSKKTMAKIKWHEALHVKTAYRVAVSVQETPEFQALTPQEMHDVACEIEQYVNALIDVRTKHGGRPLIGEIWESPDEERIQKAIDKAIKLRLKHQVSFNIRKKWLEYRSSNLLEKKRFVHEIGPGVFEEKRGF